MRSSRYAGTSIGPPLPRRSGESARAVRRRSRRGRARRVVAPIRAAVCVWRSATRSAAIRRAVFRSSTVWTRRDGRIVDLRAAGPCARAAPRSVAGRARIPAAGDRARVGDEHDGAERDERRAGRRASRGQQREQRPGGADDRERAEQRDLGPELRLAPARSGAPRAARSRRRRRSRPRVLVGVVFGSVIMKNRKTRISGEVTSTHQK